MPHSFLARKPANWTYQLWQCTTLASRLSLAIARLRYIASSAPPKRGSVFCLASAQAPYPFTRRFGSITSCSPKQRTSTGTRRDNSRPRYSTCTPAPPYTCGGYSLVKSATLLISGIGLLLSFPQEHGMLSDTTVPQLHGTLRVAKDACDGPL